MAWWSRKWRAALGLAGAVAAVAVDSCGDAARPPPSAAVPAVAAAANPVSPDAGIPPMALDAARASDFERRIRAQAGLPAPEGISWFTLALGNSRVLVTAPHGSRPMRRGMLRFADRGTATAAAMLHGRSGVTTLYTEWASPCDPNDVDACAFKDTLAVLLRRVPPALVLDLHASNGERPYDVDFGTLGGTSVQAHPELLDSLAGHLQRAGLENQSLDFFSAARRNTVTRFVAGLGVPAIQVEINAAWLRPDGDAEERERFARLLAGLAGFVASVDANAPPRHVMRKKGAR